MKAYIVFPLFLVLSLAFTQFPRQSLMIKILVRIDKNYEKVLS